MTDADVYPNFIVKCEPAENGKVQVSFVFVVDSIAQSLDMLKHVSGVVVFNETSSQITG